MTDDPTVRDHVLSAAVDAAAIHGIAKLSMADVARLAGMSRQTVYRHFPSKDALVAEVIASETAHLVDGVVAATQVHDDPRDALEAALLAALVATREHPLLDRLIRTEPESLLPLLTTDGGPVMGFVRGVVERIIAERVLVDVDPAPDPVAVRRFADIVTRLLVSYAVSAPDDPPELVASIAATILTHGALRATAISAHGGAS